jgi:S1-C subfamily serine protease
MRRFISFGPAFIVLMTIAVVLFAVPAAIKRISAADTSARIVLAQHSLDDDDILERINAATRAIATSVRPSVVHIEVSADARRRFGTRSTGSGWVFNADGYIVTNAHVVRGAERISVQFSDGRVVETEDIKGQPFLADPYTDVAVIKVAKGAGNFPIKRASGIQPQQGDHVYAFGSPFGFKFSMTQGIISGLGRDPSSAMEEGGFTNFIQTDAAVNPGNSGGPMVDIKGRMIGMSVAIATGRHSGGATDDDGGDSAGISFAIPLGTVEYVVNQLIEKGEVSRGMLGIEFRPRPERIADETGFHGTGVAINVVTDGGPADKAGLRVDDVITVVDGIPVEEPSQLRSVVSTHLPGTEVRFKAWQDGKFKDFTAVLVERPREDLLAAGSAGAMARYGMRALSRRKSVWVAMVAPESGAATAGFESGLRIDKVGEKAVTNEREFYVALGEQGLLIGKKIPLTVSKVESESDNAETKTIQVQLLR